MTIHEGLLCQMDLQGAMQLHTPTCRNMTVPFIVIWQGTHDAVLRASRSTLSLLLMHMSSRPQYTGVGKPTKGAPARPGHLGPWGVVPFTGGGGWMGCCHAILH
jgi:hypothetical protein